MLVGCLMEPSQRLVTVLGDAQPHCIQQAKVDLCGFKSLASGSSDPARAVDLISFRAEPADQHEAKTGLGRRVVFHSGSLQPAECLFFIAGHTVAFQIKVA
jgi:hypothetical protein